jgi:hypothetical protein
VNRAFLGLLVGLMGCTASQSAPFPQQLSTAALLTMAEQGQLNPVTQLPMSAGITPPGTPFYYASPPYTSTTKVNTGTQPVLNLQPGLLEGKFAPYVTTEMWTNNFGTIWYDPIYRLVNDDGTGKPLINSTYGVAEGITGDVYSVAPPDRFYTPYWGLEYIVVPDSDIAKVQANPPKTVRDVLDLPYAVFAGPNGTWSVVPSNLGIDLALQAPQETDPATLLPPWMKVIVQSEYGSGNGLQRLSVLKAPAPAGKSAPWFEGAPIASVFFGLWDFVDEPVSVVRMTPEFIFVTQAADGSTTPLGLPNVLGHGPLFSSSAVTLSGGTKGGLPNWDTAWELYQVVLPSPPAVVPEPFFPMVPDPDDPADTDVFAGWRQLQSAPTPTADFSAVIGTIAGYAGRLALNPSCFDATTPVTSIETWAASCQFLDSQEAIEAAFVPDNIIDTQTQATCPVMLWATPQ